MNDNISKALREGDAEAFEEIFITYFGKVKYFINGLLKSDADAEELAQDVFVKLWINKQFIDPQKSLNAYIYTMARNAALNHLKSISVHSNYLKEYQQEESACVTEESIHAHETELLIELSVSNMPPQRQTIYRMSRNEGITNEEIAKKLGITKKTVENQLSLALQELRKVVALLSVFF